MTKVKGLDHSGLYLIRGRLKTKITNYLLPVVAICIMTSCSTLPGHYLTKHEPGFYSKKNDAVANVTFELAGYKAGIKLRGNIALTNHLFAGINGGIHRNFKDPDYKLKGYSLRPEIGYYMGFGKNNRMYLELHAGGGFQSTSVSKHDNRGGIIFTESANPLQVFGGAYLGITKAGQKIGFDIA